MNSFKQVSSDDIQISVAEGLYSEVQRNTDNCYMRTPPLTERQINTCESIAFLQCHCRVVKINL